MKNLVLLLFLSWASFSQTIENDDYLIIEGESSKYFYILTKDGYYISELAGRLLLKNTQKKFQNL